MESGERQAKLKILTVILDRRKIDPATKNYRKQRLPVTLRIVARGTASSEMLDILGIGSTEKVIFLSIIPDIFEGAALDMMLESLQLNKPGHGIAFTVPLSGISSSLPRLLSEHLEKHIAGISEDEKDMEKTTCKTTHDLIMAVVNEGFVSEVMSAARSAGATGGTVASASRVGTENVAAVLGMDLQEEKEVVMILAKHEDKVAIMQAINTSCGVKTEARGVVLSLPVDQVIGLSPGDENQPEEE